VQRRERNKELKPKQSESNKMKLRQMCIAFTAGILLTGSYIVSGTCPNCDATVTSGDVPCKFSDYSSTGPKCRYEVWSPGKWTCAGCSGHFTGADECWSGTGDGYDIVNECPNTCSGPPNSRCTCQSPRQYSFNHVWDYHQDELISIYCF